MRSAARSASALDHHAAGGEELLPHAREEVETEAEGDPAGPRRLERNLSKDDILFLYLNQINFGKARYGVEEASLYYFNKHVQDVDSRRGGDPRRPSQNPSRIIRAATSTARRSARSTSSIACWPTASSPARSTIARSSGPSCCRRPRRATGCLVRGRGAAPVGGAIRRRGRGHRRPHRRGRDGPEAAGRGRSRAA